MVQIANSRSNYFHVQNAIGARSIGTFTHGDLKCDHPIVFNQELQYAAVKKYNALRNLRRRAIQIYLLSRGLTSLQQFDLSSEEQLKIKLHALVRIALPARQLSAWMPTSWFVALYLLLFQLSNIFQTTDLRATPWNPEAGVAVAAGALLGWRALLPMFVANFAGNLFAGTPLPWPWLVTSSLAHALVFTGSAARWPDKLKQLATPNSQVIIQFLVMVVIITAAATFARLAIISIAFRIPPTMLAPYLLTLTVGNLIGAMTVAPVAFAFSNNSDWVAKMMKCLEGNLIAFGSIIITSILVFGLKQTNEFKFFYLLFLPVIALAIRDGLPGAMLAILFNDILMMGLLYLRNFEASTVTELQILMASLSATGLFLGATVSERSRIARDLEESGLRLQESQSALLATTRISLAAEMAGALAHELNQPLSSIRNFIRSVRRKISQPGARRQTILKEIDAAVLQVDSASKLIKSTRQFLQRKEVEFGPVDMLACAKDCFMLSERDLRNSRIFLEVERPDLLPFAQGDAQQIQQVILNLLRNAREAIVNAKSKRREIKFKIDSTSRPGYLEVSVADSGPGVSDAIRKTLFNPLVSSKIDGLGLGLSLCSSIIQAHGGEIWLDAHGAGATFVFTIPTTNSVGLEA